MARETKPPETKPRPAPVETAASGRTPAPASSTGAEVADFLAKVKALGPVAEVGRGRLLFAMDATMSRAPTWDMALALLGVPAFLFQEGDDPNATRAFKEIARLTKGAHCRFGPGSAAELRALLTAVAVYAAGGRKALEGLLAKPGGTGARLLLGQMRG